MFSIWPPLHIQKELWNSNGIGWQRQSVMNRASQIKTSILGRWSDNPVASAFIAKSGNVAFLHALVVDENFRQQGVAKALMRHAGQWAHKHNCSKLIPDVKTTFSVDTDISPVSSLTSKNLSFDIGIIDFSLFLC